MSRAGTGRVAVAIVTHETRDEVLGCLASLASGEADEIVVADTGSTDGSVRAVRDAYPDVRVLELANAGFGRAANAAVRVTSSPVAVIVNADVRFLPGSVRRLARELEDDPSLAAAGPAVRYPDGRHQASARRIPDLRTAVGHAALGRVWPDNRWTRRYRVADADRAAPRDPDWLSGCALAVRRQAFDDVGGFDPGYHLYVEDVDLAVRLRRAGWSLRYQPAANVIHRVGASTATKRGRALVCHARSLDRYVGRHHDGVVWRLVRPVVAGGLAAGVALTWVWERTLGAGHSTTGERADRSVR